ncbi:MAG TPA: hypothetical protein DCG63_03720 [Methylophilaceae bacterium]|nr:hypothetical protein [Methylophilaceae bacterium]
MADNKVEIKITGDASGLGKAAKDGQNHLEKLGNSAKQTALAMRQVPMQFTDIVVSLQAGQSPMQVFLQQGGQLKDLFGGIGPAAKALSGYIIGLVSPLTIAGAAIAGVAAAAFAGSQQSERLQNALIMSGGAATTALGQMDDLAKSVGRTTGQYGLAREATEALAASGKISSENIKSALDGVVAGVKVTGKSAENLVQDFEAIGKDPVAAIKKLNESYNFLTVDIYKQISSLEEQGKHQEAVTLATDTFANTMQTRSKQVVDNAGLIEKSWLGIKSAIGGVIDQLESIGRADSLSQQVAKAQAEVDNLKARFKQQQGHGGLLGVSNNDIVEAQAKLDELTNLKKHAESTDADFKKFQEKQKDKIAQQDDLKKYLGSDARYSKSDLTAKLLADEDDAFKKATRNLEKNSQDYQSALKAHESAVANIREAASKRNKAPKDVEYEQQLAIHKESMQDIASLTQAAQKLNESDQSNVAILQEKLDAYNHLEPATQAYIQSQLDLAKAAEQEANWQKVINDSIDREIEAQNALDEATKKAADDREKTFQDLSDSLEEENENLNISLISSDKKRAKAQIDLEHQRALDHINSLMLEGEQAQALIDAETKNYNLKLKSIDQGLKGTKSITKELGMTFSSAFEDAIVKGEKFSNVLQSLAQDIEKLLLRKTVTDPLMKAVSGALDDFNFADFLNFNANGNVYSGKSISAYSGSVVSKPTFFASGGNVMGEDGPEGIFPLKRGKNGKLGVSAEGQTGTNVTINLIESPGNGGQVNQSQNGNNLTLDIVVEKIEGMLGRNISQGRGIAPVMERQYGLNRAAGAY